MADNYDYTKQQQDILYRQQLARQMAGAQTPQGSMVSGWFVPPSKGAYFANALEKIAGTYFGKKVSDEQGALDQEDRRREDAAYNKILNPSLSDERFKSIQDANPIPQASYTYQNPNEVGPRDPNAAQPMPVADSPLRAQNIPPQQYAAALQARMNPQDAQLSPLQQVSVQPSAQPAPVPQGSGFNVAQPDPAAVQAARDAQFRTVQGALGSQRAEGFNDLAGTKNGAGIARAIRVNQITNAMDAQKPTYQTVKQGEQLIRIGGGSAPQVIYDGGSRKEIDKTVDTPQGTFAVYKDGTSGYITDGNGKPVVAASAANEAGNSMRNNDKLAFDSIDKINEAQTGLNTTLSAQGKARRAIDLLTSYAPTGGLLSQATASIGKALGVDSANELDMALKDLAFADLKSSFGGNPTEGERKAQLDVKASIERGLAPSVSSLNVLLGGLARTRKTQEDTLNRYQGVYKQYRSQGDGASSGPSQLPSDQQGYYNSVFKR